MVDMLQHTALSAEQRRMLGTIHQSSLALLDILNDILDYSKIEADKLTIESIPTSLQEVLQGVLQLMQIAAQAKSIKLSLWVSPELPDWIYGDPSRLRQVLLNLVGNAIKFTHSSEEQHGRVALRVASGWRANGRPGLYLRISDNGIGIERDTMSRLFSPFTQADVSTARQFGGSGLGLSISQRLVELMGGRIKATSTPGRGSEFTVELPLFEAPAAAPGPDRQPAGPGLTPALPATQATGQRILLAEDNETNRDVLRAQLSLLGYSADVAVDGAAALALWQAGDYALLLTDCHMPRMDGFALTAAIRRAEGEGPRRPIIAVTANVMHGEAERCRAAGMDDYLSKPLRIQELQPMLAKWLAPRTPAPRAPAPAPAPAAQAPDTAPVWDSLALGELVGPDRAMQQRLLAKFLVNARAQVTELQRACEARDGPRVSRLAHPLKSSCRTVGAMRLGELCQRLEVSALAGDGDDCAKLGGPLLEAFGQVEKRIAAALQVPL
jgi:CheY-like chemotaxis protein/HPt (histidine-containing phosphotransfer) domain-containing protein